MAFRLIITGDSMQEIKDQLVKGAGDLLAYGLAPKFKNSEKDSYQPVPPVAVDLPPQAESKVEAAVAEKKETRGRKPKQEKTADIAADMTTAASNGLPFESAAPSPKVVDVEPKAVATPSPQPTPAPAPRDEMLQVLNQVFVKKGVNRLKELFKEMGVTGHNSITSAEQVAQAVGLAKKALES